jgi:beta-glucosidase
MGLFENPFADPALTAQIGSAAHRAVARQCVRESLVMLKNDNRTIPLSKNLKHLVVVGAAADDLGIQCGGWTISWQGQPGNITHGGTTILASIRNTMAPGATVTFSPAATDLKGADAVVVVVGEQPYAEGRGDRNDLHLSPSDVALVEKARSAGAPVVTVLLSGRPLILGDAMDASDAIMAAWLPGTEGEGITDVLFGDFKPTGKLPRPWPRTGSGMATASGNSPDSGASFPYGFSLND